MPAIKANSSMSKLAGMAAGGVLLLAGCGGGISIGFGSGFDDFSPDVSIAANVLTVRAGEPVRLVAAASDESGIDHVAFFRLGSNGTTQLGTDGSAPYEWTVVAPSDGTMVLSVFARATDNQGNQADSNVVTITVTQ